MHDEREHHNDKWDKGNFVQDRFQSARFPHDISSNLAGRRVNVGNDREECLLSPSLIEGGDVQAYWTQGIQLSESSL